MAQLILNRVKPGTGKRGDGLDISDVLSLLSIDLIGLVPEDEEMSRAIGFYRLGKKGPRWVKALPREPSPRHKLEHIDDKGWTCCVDTAEGWLAFDEAGTAKRMDDTEMWRKFGVKP